MQDDSGPMFDSFLVEDVILTLGNLRGSLAWFGQPGPDAAQRRAGLERIDRQLEMLEQRARSVCGQQRAEPGRGMVPDMGPVFRSYRTGQR